MRVRSLLVAVGAAMTVASAPAQAQCASVSAYTQDACQKTVDLFNFLTPQISTALAGGAATIGQGGVMGGFPHFTLGVRGSVVQGAIPKMSNFGFSTTGRASTTYAKEDQIVPMATVDGSLGIYEGFPLGVTRVGGLDLLLTATYIPTLPEGGDVTLKLPGGSTKFGGGVRVGLLQESLVVPGVAVTYVKRALPTVSIEGKSTVTASSQSAPGTFALNDLSLSTSGWRVSASKSFLVFGLQAGFGQDSYDNSAKLNVTVNAPAPVGTQTLAAAAVKNTMTRTNIYGGLSINILMVKLVGEVGSVSGGTLPTHFNTFGGDAAASRMYFSTGLRLSF